MKEFINKMLEFGGTYDQCWSESQKVAVHIDAVNEYKKHFSEIIGQLRINLNFLLYLKDWLLNCDSVKLDEKTARLQEIEDKINNTEDLIRKATT
jgi:hypothetical protein